MGLLKGTSREFQGKTAKKRIDQGYNRSLLKAVRKKEGGFYLNPCKI